MLGRSHSHLRRFFICKFFLRGQYCIEKHYFIFFYKNFRGFFELSNGP